jgi:hypothetical protein
LLHGLHSLQLHGVLLRNRPLPRSDSFATLDQEADLFGAPLTLTAAAELRIGAPRFTGFNFCTFNINPT